MTALAIGLLAGACAELGCRLFRGVFKDTWFGEDITKGEVFGLGLFAGMVAMLVILIWAYGGFNG